MRETDFTVHGAMKLPDDRLGAKYPLSVIIPIHRSNLDISICLFSLIGNPHLDLQIIVAANSDDETELNQTVLKGMVSIIVLKLMKKTNTWAPVLQEKQERMPIFFIVPLAKFAMVLTAFAKGK